MIFIDKKINIHLAIELNPNKDFFKGNEAQTGWLLFAELRVGSDQRSWPEAQIACQVLMGSLVQVFNEDINDAVVAFLMAEGINDDPLYNTTVTLIYCDIKT